MQDGMRDSKPGVGAKNVTVETTHESGAITVETIIVSERPRRRCPECGYPARLHDVDCSRRQCRG